MSLLNRLRGKNDEAAGAPLSETQPEAKTAALATAESVREIIRQSVFDPEIGLNIVDIGLVYDIRVTEGKVVDVDMTLTSPGCPVGPQIIRGVQTYISQAYPDLDAINVHIVWTPMWDPSMLSDAAKDQLGFF